MNALSRVGRYARSFTGFERDARIFLLTTLVTGAAISLYWIDFNLFLEAIGLTPSTIGLLASVASLAGVAAALPASAIADRIGRRNALLIGGSLLALAFTGFTLTSSVAALVPLVACYGAGAQALNVVALPFLAEHSTSENRNELFAAQFASTNITNIAAAIAGGAVASRLAGILGLGSSGVGPYRAVLGIMTVLALAGLLLTLRIADDRPAGRRAEGSRPRGRSLLSRFAVEHRGLMARLLLPGFLTSLGAGQIIPFLNVFIRGRFHLDLASLNAVFAVTSLGTVLAIMLQPALARRFGKVGSVVLVQTVSIPFFLVLGFSPVLWTVIGAMAVRNSLMNAGNPIFNAFAMEQLSPAERATFSAAASLLWSLGWAIAAPFYSLLQATLGFDGGYTVDFAVVIGLYSVATWLYWRWFRRSEREPEARIASPAEGLS